MAGHLGGDRLLLDLAAGAALLTLGAAAFGVAAYGLAGAGVRVVAGLFGGAVVGGAVGLSFAGPNGLLGGTLTGAVLGGLGTVLASGGRGGPPSPDP